MPKFIDIQGQTFHYLTVIERVENCSKTGRTKWKCLCKCGNYVEVIGKSLRKGSTKSCGCFKKERAKNQLTKHGKAGSKVHIVWKHMKARCYNPKDKA